MAVSEYILQTIDLTKQYRHEKVVNSVDMKIKKGDIYGFIGLNGAGKSTFIRLIAGLTRPSDGRIELFGSYNDSELNHARKRLGTLIENPGLFPNMTARQNLEVIRLQRGIPGTRCIDEVLKKVGLSNTGKKKVKSFSLGMKQRLGIAIAMLSEPEFLILDEPINGLDPIGVIEIRELLKQMNQDYGVTILISSHILSEVHQLATNYGFIHNGELIEQLTAKELDEKCRAHLLIEVDHVEKAVTVLEEKLETTSFEIMPDGKIKLYSHLNRGQIVSQTLTESGLRIEQFTPQRDTLEGYFTSLVKEGSR